MQARSCIAGRVCQVLLASQMSWLTLIEVAIVQTMGAAPGKQQHCDVTPCPSECALASHEYLGRKQRFTPNPAEAFYFGYSASRSQLNQQRKKDANCPMLFDLVM